VIYSLLADLTVIIHLAYATSVVLGLLAIFLGILCGWQWVRNFWFRVVHLAMIGVVAAEVVCGITCPLTEWENALRERAGEATYSGSFLGRLAHDLLFFEAPAWAFSVAYVLFFLAVLATFVLAPPRWPRRRSG
jgi:hypothetical protein